MDPISAGLGIAGFGLKLLGGLFGSDDSDAIYQQQQKIAQAQGTENEDRWQAMVLASRRQQLDVIRNSQRARAMALSAATNQGAQFGTGLAGGYGQISGQTNNNLLANSQQMQISADLFNNNNQIGNYQMNISQLQSNLNRDQGFMSLGGSLIQAGPTVGRLFGGGSLFNGFNFGSSSSYNNSPYNITGSLY